MSVVLLVDDDPLILCLLGDLLRKHAAAGVTLLTADGLASAERQLTSHSCDVLVTDIGLGRENGLDLVAPAKDVNPCLQAIAMTATPSLDIIRMAAAIGVSDFVVKPIDRGSFLKRIQEATDRAERWKVAIGSTVWQEFV
jgi:DNA-binding NtrC family response regulator